MKKIYKSLLAAVIFVSGFISCEDAIVSDKNYNKYPINSHAEDMSAYIEVDFPLFIVDYSDMISDEEQSPVNVIEITNTHPEKSIQINKIELSDDVLGFVLINEGALPVVIGAGESYSSDNLQLKFDLSLQHTKGVYTDFLIFNDYNRKYQITVAVE